MDRIIFIVALILIFEVSFRLWPPAPKDEHGNYLPAVEHAFYPFTPDETDSTRWYVYHIFEHAKVILLCVALTIVFSRCQFLIWMFSIDLVTFLLNYYSTWFYAFGFPIGVDIVKLGILSYVAIREALRYTHETSGRTRLDTSYYHDRYITPFLIAHGAKAQRAKPVFILLGRIKKVISRNINRSKT